MSLQPWDERYDPSIGEWTCPMCLRRVDSGDYPMCSEVCLCDDCYDALDKHWPVADAPSGLRWRYSLPHREWYLVRDGDPLLVGYLMPGAPGVWSAFAFTDSADDCCRVGGAGTLAECARALVDAVREAPP